MNSNTAIETKVNDLISRMSLEQKVGQALTLSFSGSFPHPLLYRQIRDFHCGGLRVTQGAIERCRYGHAGRSPYVLPDQYAACLNEVQKIALARPLGIPLHVSTDQEGDFSSNYCMGGVRIMPNATGLVACGDPEYARRAALATARQLRAAGIHQIHSPVMDVNSDWANPEIGPRAFSDDAAVCSLYARAFLTGLKEGGVIATGKHFPGRGDTSTDANYEVIALQMSRDLLWNRDLLPYRDNLDLLPCLMVAHTAYPAIDPSGMPASLSKPVLTDFLRGEMGYRGVVTVDNMELDGIVRLFPIAEACWRALAAGVDLILMKRENETLCEAIFTGILRAVEHGDLDPARLEEANRRVLTMKMAYGLFDAPLVNPAGALDAVRDPDTDSAMRETVARSAMIIRQTNQLLPLKPEQKILVVEQRIDSLWASNPEDYHLHNSMLMEKMLRYNGNITHVPVEYIPDGKDIQAIRAKLSRKYDVAIVTDWLHRSCGTTTPVIQTVREAGIPVITVTNSPYPRHYQQHADVVLVVYHGRGYGMEVAADILFGRAEAPGQWPLSRKVHTA